ncbi:MAG TPA: hypothetical protein VLA52_18415 [Thermohalobaculum sp.]|nr:hypothetical protein [Thermohalobaculum sp.]
MRKLAPIAILTVLALTTASYVQAGEPITVPSQGNPNYTPHPPKEGYSYPDCYCTDSDGKRVEMGQRACLRIGSREVTALCDMSVNNPTWRPETEGCPSV